MDKEQGNMEILVEKYRTEVDRLAVYLPWLEQNTGMNTTSVYNAQGDLQKTIQVPVYDSNLLRFVKEASKMQLMNRNYAYVYSRNRIHSSQDELRLISAATAKEFDILVGILSQYVLHGQTKGVVWSEGVKNGVLLAVVRKMKEIIEFWGQKYER